MLKFLVLWIERRRGVVGKAADCGRGEAGSNPAVGIILEFFFLNIFKVFFKKFWKKIACKSAKSAEKTRKNREKRDIVRFWKMRQVALSVILIFVYWEGNPLHFRTVITSEAILIHFSSITLVMASQIARGSLSFGKRGLAAQAATATKKVDSANLQVWSFLQLPFP